MTIEIISDIDKSVKSYIQKYGREPGTLTVNNEQLLDIKMIPSKDAQRYGIRFNSPYGEIHVMGLRVYVGIDRESCPVTCGP